MYTLEINYVEFFKLLGIQEIYYLIMYYLIVKLDDPFQYTTLSSKIIASILGYIYSNNNADSSNHMYYYTLLISIMVETILLILSTMNKVRLVLKL